MLMKKKIYVSVVLISCLQSLPSHASCDVGPVLFRDTLLGAAVGTGVGALLLIANQSSQNIAPILATGALAGAGVGVIVGAVELHLSCDSSSHRRHRDEEAQASGWHAHPIVTVVDHEFHQVSAPHENFQIDTKHLGMGLGLTYYFDN